MFSWVIVPHASAATTVMENAAKQNTNLWSTQPYDEGEMDHANIVAKPMGQMNRPRLSDMLNSPASFPRITEGTMVVGAIVNAR